MQEDELRKINNFILYVAKGYPQALEAIYENIGGRMLSVAFSVLKDRYLAEDVVQDSFLKIAKMHAVLSRARTESHGFVKSCGIPLSTI